MNSQETTQQRFKELLQDIYVTAQTVEHIKTTDLVLEIQKKLTVVLENKH